MFAIYTDLNSVQPTSGKPFNIYNESFLLSSNIYRRCEHTNSFLRDCLYKKVKEFSSSNRTFHTTKINQLWLTVATKELPYECLSLTTFVSSVDMDMAGNVDISVGQVDKLAGWLILWRWAVHVLVIWILNGCEVGRAKLLKWYITLIPSCSR